MARNEVADFSNQGCVNYGYFINSLYRNLVLENFDDNYRYLGSK